MIAKEHAARRAPRFKPPRNATLAQLVERLIRNQQVAGSTPAGGSIKLARRACRSSSRETLYRIRDRLAGSLFDAGDGQCNTAPQPGFLLERRTLDAYLVHRKQPDAFANFPSHGVK